MDAPQLGDIQAFILHTYRPRALRVIVLAVREAAGARRFLGRLVEEGDGKPWLATADQWTGKHEHRVNVGVTHAGLAAMGLPAASLDAFPEEFIGGAVAAAPRVGDTGASAPECWDPPFARDDVHVILFLFVTEHAKDTEATVAEVTERLRALYAGSCAELALRDARSLPGDVAHFGYRDGFAQPDIDIPGGPPPVLPDILPKSPPGEFLLGYENLTTDSVPSPAELARNGSYAAVRILKQDCAGFEAYLTEVSAQTALDRELVAAKLCGRWRSGAPLSLYPTADDTKSEFHRYNAFDYVKTDRFDGEDDARGYRCPVGSHVRRMNPRHSRVAGNSGLSHRIVRRGLPYGAAFDPANPDDGIERGLLGLFIGASLKNQFEFLMKHWANDGGFAGVGRTKDPILGDNSKEASQFLLPVEGSRKPLAIGGLARMVETRGGAYCFLPSVTAIRYLSALS
jgi:Dyp-type peroxidase family